RLLRRGGVIEVDDALPVDLPLQEWKIAAHRLNINTHDSDKILSTWNAFVKRNFPPFSGGIDGTRRAEPWAPPPRKAVRSRDRDSSDSEGPWLSTPWRSNCRSARCTSWNHSTPG